MKTEAAVLVGIHQSLVLQELTIPKLQTGQCLVRIQAAGVCRTQLNEQAGLKGEDPYLPHLLGHEAAGTVEEIGSGVTKVKPGDYVVVSWIKGTGADVAGGTYINQAGETIHSGGAAVFTQYAVVSENRLTPIPTGIPPAIAALLGCAVPTGIGAIMNTLALTTGQSAVIFGVGGVGGAALLGAQVVGCRPIVAVDITPEKLNFARQLGATHVVSNDHNDAVQQIRALLPRGADAAVEASGLSSVGEQALLVLQRHGHLVIAGHPARGSKMCIDPFMLIEGRTIRGTWGGDVDPDVDLPRYAQLYLSGELPLDKLITHRYQGLAHVNTAMNTLRDNGIGRVVLELS